MKLRYILLSCTFINSISAQLSAATGQFNSETQRATSQFNSETQRVTSQFNSGEVRAQRFISKTLSPGDTFKFTQLHNYVSPYIKSNNCKLNCIDDGHYFCADPLFSTGMCCTPGAACEALSNGYVGGCSNDQARVPLHYEYFYCPNEEECGTRDVRPLNNGEVLTRTVEKYTDNHFLKDDVCSYIVHAPHDQMLHTDKMMMRIDNIQEAKVAVQKTRCDNLRFHPHLWTAQVEEDDEFETAKGWCFMVIGYAKNIFKGSWRMRIWIEGSDKFQVDPNKELKQKNYELAKTIQKEYEEIQKNKEEAKYKPVKNETDTNYSVLNETKQDGNFTTFDILNKTRNATSQNQTIVDKKIEQFDPLDPSKNITQNKTIPQNKTIRLSAALPPGNVELAPQKPSTRNSSTTLFIISVCIMMFFLIFVILCFWFFIRKGVMKSNSGVIDESTKEIQDLIKQWKAKNAQTGQKLTFQQFISQIETEKELSNSISQEIPLQNKPLHQLKSGNPNDNQNLFTKEQMDQLHHMFTAIQKENSSLASNSDYAARSFNGGGSKKTAPAASHHDIYRIDCNVDIDDEENNGEPIEWQIGSKKVSVEDPDKQLQMAQMKRKMNEIQNQIDSMVDVDVAELTGRKDQIEDYGSPNASAFPRQFNSVTSRGSTKQQDLN